MKEHFKLQGMDEVIIWRNETPVEPFLSRDVLRADMKASSVFLGKTNELVIELRQPRGPRCLYGLLGAKFQHTNDLQLHLQIGGDLLDARLFSGSLLGQIETPRYGLPENGATHILNALQKEIEEQKLAFSGTLAVCFAAHGDISSNIQIFKLLAKALPNFLFRESLNADFVMEIFSKPSL